MAEYISVAAIFNMLFLSKQQNGEIQDALRQDTLAMWSV